MKRTLLGFMLSGLLLALPQESVPEGEAKAIEFVKQAISMQVRGGFQKSGKAVRDAHAKAHGCVRAELKVREDLPSELRTQLYQPGAQYPAWIRFSNGSGKSQNDTEGDGRGMAVKIMGVGGVKLANEKATQDILTINHPVFFVRNAEEYVEFTKATATGSPLKFFFPGINPLHFRLHEMGIAKAIQGKKVNDMLATRFWTMTPVSFGEKAAKLSFIPCSNQKEVVSNKNNPDFLRLNMSEHLRNQEGCFILAAQIQTDAEKMPIEDPTIEWSEKASPFVSVAMLTIPKQSFESEKQQAFCENLSMNPWHSTEDHRPLGGINRVRRVVYETIANLRHELNREAQIEPNGNESF